MTWPTRVALAFVATCGAVCVAGWLGLRALDRVDYAPVEVGEE